MSSFFRHFTLASVALALCGCLSTRNEAKEQEEKLVLKKTVSNLQQTTADVNQRFQDVDDELRKITGRIETVETRLAQVTDKATKGAGAVDQKVTANDAAYREEFTKLQTQVDELKKQLADMQESQKRVAQVSAPAADNPKTQFQAAEGNFEKKNWKEAILDYEKYRKAYPKGKDFSAATYKIGVSFQELGMIDEAKAFYEEVLAKFPKSKDAKSAGSRLKGLKKK
ncbi:MAG: tetratricopeptide repeat protein [Bdellovibrionota bacterium]